MIIKRLRIEKNIIDTVVRSLEGKGELSVQVGQEVTPDEIIGNSVVSSGFRIINIAHLLGINKSELERFLQRRVGQKIYKGELLAYKKGGLFKEKKIITAPTDGVIDFVNPSTGEIKMSFLPKNIALPAGVFGIVESVDRNRGQVLIKTQISRIHGVFGSGRVRDGILRVLKQGQDLIDSGSVSGKDAGHVLVGRGLIYKDAISAAISIGINGIITGGINVSDYRGMAGGTITFPKKFDNDIGISLVVCEGFGSVPIGEDIFDLLLQFNQRFVFINGNQAMISIPESSSECMARVRKTAIPPVMPNAVSKTIFTESVESVSLGSKVRVIGTTFLGAQGKIIAIDKSKTKLASGIWAQLVTIETKTRKLQIPLTNIEII